MDPTDPPDPRVPPDPPLELLDTQATFDAEYAEGLSNHGPMALLALARLGAREARLHAFAQTYARRLRPAPAAQRWPAGEAWAGRFGQPQSWSMYRDLFQDWFLTEPAAVVLSQALPQLMQGCGAAAFHGLIRTAYAVQARHPQELVDALAYWACRWLDLGPAGAAGTVAVATADPETVLRRLRATPSDAGLIWQRMHHAAQDRHFQATVVQLQVTADTLPRLATLGAQAYAASGNFTALHLLTSAHAVRLLLPYLDDEVSAVQGYWRAFAAAVCASGMRDGTAPAPRPWPALVAAALASDDDHLIKLVYSCQEEHRAYGGAGPWQQAATRGCAGQA